LGGDFNAHAPFWGTDVDDPDGRGLAVLDWMAVTDLAVLNDGRYQTFRSTRSSSFVDLTLGTPDMVASCQGWQVLFDTSSGSDHCFIQHEWSPSGTVPAPPPSLDQKSF
jgi:hypothetical protein